MWVDCTTCRARGTGCDGCVMVLLDPPTTRRPGWPAPERADPDPLVGLDAEERRAVGVLVRAGLLGDGPVEFVERAGPAIRRTA